jgi:hypothetical protein
VEGEGGVGVLGGEDVAEEDFFDVFWFDACSFDGGWVIVS